MYRVISQAADKHELSTLIHMDEELIRYERVKSSDPNEIISKMLQSTKDLNYPRLAKIFNTCLQYNYVPIVLEGFKNIFIPKAGRTSQITVKVFKYISLT